MHSRASAAASEGRQDRHLSLLAGAADTLHLSTTIFKWISIKSRFLLYWDYSSLLPSNLLTFFHPQKQLYPVGGGNLGQITLSFWVFLSPVHGRIIVALCRLFLLLSPPSIPLPAPLLSGIISVRWWVSVLPKAVVLKELTVSCYYHSIVHLYQNAWHWVYSFALPRDKKHSQFPPSMTVNLYKVIASNELANDNWRLQEDMPG